MLSKCPFDGQVAINHLMGLYQDFAAVRRSLKEKVDLSAAAVAATDILREKVFLHMGSIFGS
jgi:hypothetical protein